MPCDRLKRRPVSTRLHCAISQKAAIFLLAVRTWNLTVTAYLSCDSTKLLLLVAQRGIFYMLKESEVVHCLCRIVILRSQELRFLENRRSSLKVSLKRGVLRSCRITLRCVLEMRAVHRPKWASHTCAQFPKLCLSPVEGWTL
jgi:hypothetical protein